MFEIENDNRILRAHNFCGDQSRVPRPLLPESTTVVCTDPIHLVIQLAHVVSTFWPYSELDLSVGSFACIHANFQLGRSGIAFTSSPLK